MINAGRCNDCDGGGGAGGYVNHCEQALGDNNEMVMAATAKFVFGDDHVRKYQTTVTSANRVYSVSSSEIDALKEFAMCNFDLIKELKVCLVKKDERIVELSKEVDHVSDAPPPLPPSTGGRLYDRVLTYGFFSLPFFSAQLKHKLDEANKHLAEMKAREESLDVLPFTPVSSTSTCSSGMGDLSSVELHEQQDVKPKRRRNRQAAVKQSNASHMLEPVQTKRQRTRSNRAKSSDLNEW